MRINIGAAAAAILLTLAPLPASADVKTGINAWESGDYSSAVAAWKPLAEQGDADAQFNLAQAYRFGKGVPLDLTQAEKWYRSAADQGHRQAEDNLGLVMFQNGNQKDALPLIRTAADRGDARAQFVLGTVLFNGDLAPRDWPAAYAYTSRAANAGLQRARLRLAEMDSYLSVEDRQKGIVLAQQMEHAAQAPAVRLLPAPSATASLLMGRGAALPPPPKSTPSSGVGKGETQSAAPPIAIMPPVVPAPAQPPSPTPPAMLAPSGLEYPATSAAVPIPDPREKPKHAQAPAPKSAPTPVWRVQLGAFADADSARALWKKLRPRFTSFAGLHPLFEKAGAMTRLRAGPMPDKAAAVRFCAQAKAIGQPCLVVAP